MGATVTIDLVAAGPTHNWNTLSMGTAINWITQFTLPPHPPVLDEFADGVGEYLYTEVRALEPSQVSHYEVALTAATNSLTISGTDHLGTLAVDLAAAGLDPLQVLTLHASSADGTGDAYVLQGYAQAPSQVLLFGIFPPLAWVHDPVKGEVTIIPNADGAYAPITVIP
jgi:hypothetical protein